MIRVMQISGKEVEILDAETCVVGPTGAITGEDFLRLALEAKDLKAARRLVTFGIARLGSEDYMVSGW